MNASKKTFFNGDAGRSGGKALRNGCNVVNLAAWVGLKVRVKDHDTVAHDQKAVQWNALRPHVIERFGQNPRIQSLTLRARRFPRNGWRLFAHCWAERTDQQEQARNRKEASPAAVTRGIPSLDHSRKLPQDSACYPCQ